MTWYSPTLIQVYMHRIVAFTDFARSYGIPPLRGFSTPSLTSPPKSRLDCGVPCLRAMEVQSADVIEWDKATKALAMVYVLNSDSELSLMRSKSRHVIWQEEEQVSAGSSGLTRLRMIVGHFCCPSAARRLLASSVLRYHEQLL